MQRTQFKGNDRVASSTSGSAWRSSCRVLVKAFPPTCTPRKRVQRESSVGTGLAQQRILSRNTHTASQRRFSRSLVDDTTKRKQRSCLTAVNQGDRRRAIVGLWTGGSCERIRHSLQQSHQATTAMVQTDGVFRSRDSRQDRVQQSVSCASITDGLHPTTRRRVLPVGSYRIHPSIITRQIFDAKSSPGSRDVCEPRRVRRVSPEDGFLCALWVQNVPSLSFRMAGRRRRWLC